ncbi:MAG: diphthine--ammonia ligase [Nitrosopumilaceae archaeon]|nr:diphthine--ammonia ligase [Nitrosopumilaceae archaeon]
MKLAALSSGGKDSIYAIYNAQKNGHNTECLLTISPPSAESLLLHYQNTILTKLQSLSMNKPHIYKISTSNNIDHEIQMIKNAILDAIVKFDIDGLVHGCISSKFQINKLHKICNELNLKLYTPLQHYVNKNYLTNLIEDKFHFIVVAVSADGLNKKWLGKKIVTDDLSILNNLSDKYGFNINFDGGEAETFVTDCPLFKHPIKINRAKTMWDGYRGIFDIQEAELDYNAR